MDNWILFVYFKITMNFQVAILNGHSGMLYGYATILGLSITGLHCWTELLSFLDKSVYIFRKKPKQICIKK